MTENAYSPIYRNLGDQQDTFKRIPENYEVVLKVSLPNSIPFQGINLGKKVYIAVPKNRNCQN